MFLRPLVPEDEWRGRKKMSSADAVFNHLSHGWLLRMIRLRVGDPVILRLVGKWLRAGVLMDELVVRIGEGAARYRPYSQVSVCIRQSPGPGASPSDSGGIDRRGRRF